MSLGSTCTDIVNLGMGGAVWFEAKLMYPTIPTDISYDAGYKHQKGTAISTPSVTVNFPLAVGITVTPESAYNSSVIDHLICEFR